MLKNSLKWISLFAMIGVIVAGCSETTLVEDGSSDAIVLSKDSPGYIGFDFKFNIIGVKKDKNPPMDNDNGKRLFVQLYGGDKVCDPDITDTSDPYHCDNTQLKGGGSTAGGWFTDITYSKKNKILLTPCEPSDPACDFDILDANATDGDGGEIQMPDDVSTKYEVYARALGKPGGSARITTCADENYIDTGDTGYETWCSLTSAVLERETGKPKVENVTNELLFLDIVIDTAVDSTLAQCLGETADDTVVQIDDIPLFDGCFENYFWNYDNNGLKNLQVWFKEVPNGV